MLSVTQLLATVSEDEAMATILGLLQDAGFNATSWGVGSLQRKFLRWGAKIYSDLTQLAAALVSMGFNDTATGEGLTRFSRSHYDNDRQLATPTLGVMVLTNTGSVAYTVVAGTLAVAYVGPDGVQRTYRNLDGGSVGPNSSLALTWQAETPGALWNVPNISSLQLVTSIAGVTVTNPAISGTLTWYTVAGTDEESDERLRLRNATKWSTLSIERSRDAIINFALTASAAVTRVGVDDQNPDGPFTFRVYVAGPSTIGSADLAAVTDYIAVRLLGASGTVALAPQQELPLAGTVWFDRSFSAGVVQAAVEQAIADYLASAPLGGFDFAPGPSHVVRVNDLENVIKDATIAGVKPVKTVTLSDPSADVDVASYGIVVRGDWSGLSYVAVNR